MPPGWEKQYREAIREAETMPPPPILAEIAEAQGLHKCPACRGSGFVTEEVAALVEAVVPGHDEAPDEIPTDTKLVPVDAPPSDLFALFEEKP